MVKGKLFKSTLALALSLSMICSPVAHVSAAEVSGSWNFEKIENSAIEASLLREEAAVKKAANQDADLKKVYKDSDRVRVSILLEEPSVLDAGYDTEELLDNAAALQHLDKVKKNQKNLEKKIAKAAKKSVKVKHNLGLAANIISADVTYGDIDEIEAVSGVKEVVLENLYTPCEATETVEPRMFISSGNMTGAQAAWSEGYTGAGARIAIIDTGLDLDHQSFDNDAYIYSITKGAVETGNVKNKKTDKKTMKSVSAKLALLDEKEISKALPYLNAYEEMNGEITSDNLFITNKIPFGFNYVDSNLNVRHIYDEQGQHGSHVAGIACANRYLDTDHGKASGMVDALETVGVAGNAPDAQILVMKVFGESGGAYDSDYMAAIEDAILLGCDSVNLSLGSASAGMVKNDTYQDIMDRLVSTNAVVAISAGNSGQWADESRSGKLYQDGVNFSTTGSPGSYTNSLGVASVDNDGMYGPYFTVAGQPYLYTEYADYGNLPLASLAEDGSAEYEYVFIDGLGTEEDFADLDLNGKIAICKRGTLYAVEKANNAASQGAIATIIYNNEPGTYATSLSNYEFNAPVVTITQEEGAAIRAASLDQGGYFTGSLTVSTGTTANVKHAEYYAMSEFSSWGVPGDLSLKPEITAPGGDIYSVNGSYDAGGGPDQYLRMSGTSMACPQVSGMAAVLKRYIKENGIKSSLSDRGLAQSLLMSTARPLEAEDGYIYSVMQQGAGLGNVKSAIDADSYIVMGQDATASCKDGKVKAELGDDPDRKGLYSFSFTLNNITKKSVTYELDADVFTQACAGGMLHDYTVELPASVSFQVDGKNTSSVTVKKNGSTSVQVTIALSDDTRQSLNEKQPAGAYVEAFIHARPANGSSAHHIPVLGYYGSWTDPSMFDVNPYTDHLYGLEERPPYLFAENGYEGNAYVMTSGDGEDCFFGGNRYADEAEYNPAYNALNNENGDLIKKVSYTLIRNAGKVVMQISNAETGEIYAAKNGKNLAAFYSPEARRWYDSNYTINLGWAGTDAEGQPLAEGTRVALDLIAAPEYYCAADGSFDPAALGQGAYFSTELVIDNTAPVIETIVDQESGSLGVKASDNEAIAAILVYSENGKELIERKAVSSNAFDNCILTDLEADVYLVAVLDYAGNMSTYRVFLNTEASDEVSEVTLDKESMVLMKNTSQRLSAKAEPVNVRDDSVLWSSSDETVATVDKNGKVTGVGVGECVITAASVLNPMVTAECRVSVITIEDDLNAVLCDNTGHGWFVQFNTGTIPEYQKLASCDEADIIAMAYGSNGRLYAADLDTSNGLSALYSFDPSSYKLSLIKKTEDAYTDLSEAPHLGENALLATSLNNLIVVDANSGETLFTEKYGENSLVGIAYAGTMAIAGMYIDAYYLLDELGNLYFEGLLCMGGNYMILNGPEKGMVASTGITCDLPYNQSLYFNGERTILSSFNQSKNSVTFYDLETELDEDEVLVYELGSFGDGVWPVAALTSYDGPVDIPIRTESAKGRALEKAVSDLVK